MNVTLELLEDGRIIGKARQHTVEVGLPAPGSAGGGGITAPELLLLALGCCKLGNIRSYAAQRGISLKDVRFDLEGEVAEAPSRVARISIVARIGDDLKDLRLETLEAVANRCKIHNTLRETPEIEFRLLTGAVEE
ncbi:MAG: OsmC family protein [Chloroflexi bacterium]|nr:OsmC family protein [Chloroflexota bacterium]